MYSDLYEIQFWPFNESIWSGTITSLIKFLLLSRLSHLSFDVLLLDCFQLLITCFLFFFSFLNLHYTPFVIYINLFSL